MCGNYDSFLETLPQNRGRDPAEQSSWDILVTISMGAAGHRGWSRNFLTGKGRRGGLGWQPLSPCGSLALWTQTILYWEGRCWSAAGGWHRVTRFYWTGGMHKIAYLEKNSAGAELHGEYWQCNEGCKFQLAPMMAMIGDVCWENWTSNLHDPLLCNLKVPSCKARSLVEGSSFKLQVVR